MAIEHLKKCTSEELATMQVKATQARKDKAAFNKANEHLYKLEYLDSGHWQELATKYKIRMPTYNEPATEKGIRKYLRKCGVSGDAFAESYGSVKDWIKNNPRWTLYGCTGTILELKDLQ